jgi:hypothetical protein
MKFKRELPFDSKVFPSKVNRGRVIYEYLKDECGFTQGERILSSAFRAARSKGPWSPSKEWKPWSHFWEPAISRCVENNCSSTSATCANRI